MMHSISPCPSPLSLVTVQDKDVAEVGINRAVGDYPGEADLGLSFKYAKAQGMVDGFFHRGAGPSFRPIGTGKIAMDDGGVHAAAVGADGIDAPCVLLCHSPYIPKVGYALLLEATSLKSRIKPGMLFAPAHGAGSPPFAVRAI